jgi:hypothetical protein
VLDGAQPQLGDVEPAVQVLGGVAPGQQVPDQLPVPARGQGTGDERGVHSAEHQARVHLPDALVLGAEPAVTEDLAVLVELLAQ